MEVKQCIPTITFSSAFNPTSLTTLTLFILCAPISITFNCFQYDTQKVFRVLSLQQQQSTIK